MGATQNAVSGQQTSKLEVLMEPESTQTVANCQVPTQSLQPKATLQKMIASLECRYFMRAQHESLCAYLKSSA